MDDTMLELNRKIDTLTAQVAYLADREQIAGRNLERLLEQLESLSDLADTVGPLADEAFGKTVDVLSAFERKGYFAFARGGLRMTDNVVAAFTEEDIQRLGDNVVLILSTIRDLTQPE